MKKLSIRSDYTPHPEDKLITASRINAAKCPYKYFKEYVEEPKSKPAFESIELGLGSYFHYHVEEHFKHIQIRENSFIRKNDIINTDDMVNKFKMSFIWEGKLREPYKIVSNKYTLEQYLERLKRFGKNFNDFIISKLISHEIIKIEGSIELGVDDYKVRGKYDLITKTKKGEYFLWDWKTGAMPSPKYFKEFYIQKAQLGIYAIWMKNKYKTSTISGNAVFLRDYDYDVLSENFTEDIEKNVLDYLINWRKEMNKTKEYPPITSMLCDWCGWNTVCSAYSRHVTVSPSSYKRDRSSCFIANYVFYPNNENEIITLCRFRDNFLRSSLTGNAIIKLYEFSSPFCIELIGKNKIVIQIIRYLLINFNKFLGKLKLVKEADLEP